MRCNYDYDIILKGLNLLHRDIILGETDDQESGIERLVQLVRYFRQYNHWGTLAEEAENLERAAEILTASGEIQSCRFADKGAELPDSAVERFSVFNTCFAELVKETGKRAGAYEIAYDAVTGSLRVKAMVD